MSRLLRTLDFTGATVRWARGVILLTPYRVWMILGIGPLG